MCLKKLRNSVTAITAGVLLAGWLILGDESTAQTTPVVSIDAVPDASNTATTLGSIEACRAATTGASFTADLVVQNITGVTGAEAHLIYNAAVLSVTAVDYGFLIGSAGGSLVELGETTPDADGDFQLGVVTFPLAPATGSGVLARITFEAIGAGISALDVQDVKLSDALGAPIQPADPVTGIFTGTVGDGTAIVGAGCADVDGDGYPDTAESWVATDPLDNCGNPASSTPVYSLAWPADLATSGTSANKVTLADVTSFVVPVRILNTSPGHPNYNQRWDIVPGSSSGEKINLQDLTSLTTLKPDMFGKQRAFNGPTCSP